MSSRRLGMVGALVGASAVLALSSAGVATAGDKGGPPKTFPHYATYQACVTAGNKFAQQGVLHGYRCDHTLDPKTLRSYWKLTQTA